MAFEFAVEADGTRLEAVTLAFVCGLDMTGNQLLIKHTGSDVAEPEVLFCYDLAPSASPLLRTRVEMGVDLAKGRYSLVLSAGGQAIPSRYDEITKKTVDFDYDDFVVGPVSMSLKRP